MILIQCNVIAIDYIDQACQSIISIDHCDRLPWSCNHHCHQSACLFVWLRKHCSDWTCWSVVRWLSQPTCWLLVSVINVPVKYTDILPLQLLLLMESVLHATSASHHCSWQMSWSYPNDHLVDSVWALSCDRTLLILSIPAGMSYSRKLTLKDGWRDWFWGALIIVTYGQGHLWRQLVDISQMS